MISLDILGFTPLRIAHLVLDFNGTLAVNGKLLPGIKKRIVGLAGQLRVHVLTADTFGSARAELRKLPCELVILDSVKQDRAKAAYVRRLGAPTSACIGNGRNDRLMLREAVLGIAVIQAEGSAFATMFESDIVVTDVRDALDMLSEPARLIATLRA